MKVSTLQNVYLTRILQERTTLPLVSVAGDGKGCRREPWPGEPQVYKPPQCLPGCPSTYLAARPPGGAARYSSHWRAPPVLSAELCSGTPQLCACAVRTTTGCSSRGSPAAAVVAAAVAGAVSEISNFCFVPFADISWPFQLVPG